MRHEGSFRLVTLDYMLILVYTLKNKISLNVFGRVEVLAIKIFLIRV